ncbi:hypothetical protein GYMLUDRAFT_137424, partial [Collybiopsis luxurians FD-317 M1]
NIMPTPPAYKGLRLEYLTNCLKQHNAATKGDNWEGFILNTICSYLKHFLPSLADNEDPSTDHLKSVDDRCPDPE